MEELKSTDAVVTATITVQRAGTGEVETYNLTFTPIPEEKDTPQESS